MQAQAAALEKEFNEGKQHANNLVVLLNLAKVCVFIGFVSEAVQSLNAANAQEKSSEPKSLTHVLNGKKYVNRFVEYMCSCFAIQPSEEYSGLSFEKVGSCRCPQVTRQRSDTVCLQVLVSVDLT